MPSTQTQSIGERLLSLPLGQNVKSFLNNGQWSYRHLEPFEWQTEIEKFQLHLFNETEPK